MCDKCGMTFYHNSNLKKHIETTHAVQHKVSDRNRRAASNLSSHQMIAPMYPGPLDGLMDPNTDQLYNFRHGFNSPYDGYSYAPYHHHMSQTYHQHNHYYQNNVYYGRQWW